MDLRSLGLIVNPNAGSGKRRNLEVASRAIGALKPGRVLTGPGDLGAEAAPAAQIVEVGPISGRAATQALARKLAQAEIDALVVVGGDGTLADAALALHRAGSTCPIFGIGAGTINAGKLVTCPWQAASSLGEARFSVEAVTALTTSVSGELFALAFNDIVISTTVVGTVGGEAVDLDAHAFLHGRQTPAEPFPIHSPTAQVIKAGRFGKRYVAGAELGTLIAGFTDSQAFFGKAIAGPVLLASLSGALAGCLVCEQPLVRTQLAPAALAEIEPVHCTFTGLFLGEVIEISGLTSPAILCADGNPLLPLEPQHVVQIGLAENTVQAVRMSESQEQGPPSP